MILPANSETTIIRHLRVQAARLDPQTARLRAEFALSAADLRPPGLSPAAVLCVRRLRDPRPGGLDLRRPGQTAPRAWQAAVQDALANLARGAARPANEAVPAGAEAVLFADQAELIACLARDWLEGHIFERWWWHSLLRGAAEMADLVEQSWVEAPAYLPAALEALAHTGQAAAFARSLPAQSARRILAAGLAHFGLAHLQSALNALPLQWAASESPAPWLAYAPESAAPDLNIPQQALVGVGLALRRAPQRVSGAAFAVQLRAWAESAAVTRVKDHPPLPNAVILEQMPPPPGAALRLPAIAPADDELLAAQAQVSPQIQPAPVDPSTPPGPPDYPAQLPTQDQPRPRVDTPAPASLAAAGMTEQPEGAQPSERETIAAELLPASRLIPAAAPWPEPLNGIWFQTGFGGLFYLINLGLFLDLYADFTRPLDVGIDLPLWDFLALVGLALCGPPLKADPAWGWLARLAGRDAGDAPGSAFDPPQEWRLPAGWLRPFDSLEGWAWGVDADRLLIRHPAGFMALDIPVRGSPARTTGGGNRRIPGIICPACA